MANHGHGPGNPPPSSHNKARKLSYQPHKLTAAQRRHIEAGYAAQLEQLQTQLATLQVDSIRLKNRGMLLEQQLAIKNDQLWEVSGHVQTFDWAPSLPRVGITPGGRPILNGNPFASSVVQTVMHTDDDNVQHLYDARETGMANMVKLVTWLDATECPAQRQRIIKQIFQEHGMMMSAALAVGARDPLLMRKLGIRWHHHQPHLDRIDGHVLRLMKPVVDAFAFTPVEIIDLMHMRSTYIRRFNSLLDQRRHLTSQMHQCAMRPALTVSLTERDAAREVLQQHRLACKLRANLHQEQMLYMQFLNSLISKYFFPRTIAGARKMQHFLPDFPDDLIFMTAIGILAGHLDMYGNPIRALPPLGEQRLVAQHSVHAQYGGHAHYGGQATHAQSFAAHEFAQAIAEIVEVAEEEDLPTKAPQQQRATATGLPTAPPNTSRVACI